MPHELLTRRAPTGTPSSVDLETGTAIATLTTSVPVERNGIRPDGAFGRWREILDMRGVDLGRLPISLLLDHRRLETEAKIGIVESAAVDREALIGSLRFSRRELAREVLQDVADLGGNLSIGYRVLEWRREGDDREAPTYRATAWELMESSLVNVPADAAARIRSLENTMADDTPPAAPAATTTTTAPAVGADQAGDVLRQAMADIRRVHEACRSLRIDPSIGDQLLERGLSADAASRELLDRAGQRDQADQVFTRAGVTVHGGHDGTDPDFRFGQAVDALAHRLSGGRLALPESAEPVRGMSLLELHRHAGERQRGQTGGWLNRAGFGGGHTTSDFPVLLLESAANRALLDAFMVAASPLRQVARMVQVDDFRQITRARRGEAAKLLEIAEHGEVQSSTVGEELERYVVKTYARNFILSRNAIINDDLNAFADFLADMGRAAAITEAGVLVGLITGDGVTLADGTTLWHSNHGNLAGSGAAPDVTTLGAARSSMRLQTSPTNAEPLNLVPRFLLVPAALETTVDKLLAEISAAKAEDVNVFSNRLAPLVEPRLDAVSDAAWYVVADPGTMPFLEIATLTGARPMATAGGPELRTFEGEDVLGLKYRAVHDFGAFPINFRAAFKNAGE